MWNTLRNYKKYMIFHEILKLHINFLEYLVIFFSEWQIRSFYICMQKLVQLFTHPYIDGWLFLFLNAPIIRSNIPWICNRELLGCSFLPIIDFQCVMSKNISTYCRSAIFATYGACSWKQCFSSRFSKS